MAEFGVQLKAPKGKRLVQDLCQVSSPPQQENDESGTNLDDEQSEEKTIPEQKTLQRDCSPDEVVLNLDLVKHFNQLTSTDCNAQSKTDKPRAKGESERKK